jgi:glycerophosphoryl diester phosphodiesterase
MILPPEFQSAPIAHRALHDAEQGIPENSRGAVQRAVRAGYGIEIDVHLSADGRAIVFHDDTLDRLTHTTGPVGKRTARELSDLVLKGSDERIPTLPTFSTSWRAGAASHRDQGPVRSHRRGRGCAGTCRGRGPAGLRGPVAVMSFNPHVVAAMRNHAPACPARPRVLGLHPSQWPQISPETCMHLRSISDFGRVGAGSSAMTGPISAARASPS